MMNDEIPAGDVRDFDCFWNGFTKMAQDGIKSVNAALDLDEGVTLRPKNVSRGWETKLDGDRLVITYPPNDAYGSFRNFVTARELHGIVRAFKHQWPCALRSKEIRYIMAELALTLHFGRVLGEIAFGFTSHEVISSEKQEKNSRSDKEKSVKITMAFETMAFAGSLLGGLPKALSENTCLTRNGAAFKASVFLLTVAVFWMMKLGRASDRRKTSCGVGALTDGERAETKLPASLTLLAAMAGFLQEAFTGQKSEDPPLWHVVWACREALASCGKSGLSLLKEMGQKGAYSRLESLGHQACDLDRFKASAKDSLSDWQWRFRARQETKDRKGAKWRSCLPIAYAKPFRKGVEKLLAGFRSDMNSTPLNYGLKDEASGLPKWADAYASILQLVLNLYFLGHLAEAYSLFAAAMDFFVLGSEGARKDIEGTPSYACLPHKPLNGLVAQAMPDWLYCGELTKGHCLYRARAGKPDDIDFITGDEMFHVPFELRVKVHNERYSVAGLPCLYLGDSVYSCWAELGRPEIGVFNTALISLGKDVKFFDMVALADVYRCLKEDPLSLVGSERLPLITLAPLVILSSLRVSEGKEPFKPEYVIPQLLVQWLLSVPRPGTNRKGMTGVRYYTSAMGVDFMRDRRLFINYAFPVLSLADKGSCQELMDSFSVQSCLPGKLAQYAGDPAWHMPWEVDGRDSEDITPTGRFKLKYPKTLFGYIERYLNCAPSSSGQLQGFQENNPGHKEPLGLTNGSSQTEGEGDDLRDSLHAKALFAALTPREQAALGAAYVLQGFVPSQGCLFKGLDDMEARLAASIAVSTLPRDGAWIERLAAMEDGPINLTGPISATELASRNLAGYVAAGIKESGKTYDRALSILERAGLVPPEGYLQPCRLSDYDACDCQFRDQLLEKTKDRHTSSNDGGNDAGDGYRRLPVANREMLRSFSPQSPGWRRPLSDYQRLSLERVYNMYDENRDVKAVHMASFKAEWAKHPALKALGDWWGSLPLSFLLTPTGLSVGQMFMEQGRGATISDGMDSIRWKASLKRYGTPLWLLHFPGELPSWNRAGRPTPSEIAINFIKKNDSVKPFRRPAFKRQSQRLRDRRVHGFARPAK